MTARQQSLPGIPAKMRPRASKAAGYRRQEREWNEQRALFRFLSLHKRKYPQLAVIHSSLNGVHLTDSQAAKASQAGMLAGVWDCFVPVPRYYKSDFADSHDMLTAGLYVEMKIKPNDLTPEQIAFREAVGDGYEWAVAFDWLEALRAIVDYLGIVDPAIEDVLKVNQKAPNGGREAKAK